MRRPRVAFVVPRAGADLFDSAGSLCVTVAREMAQRWDVEIITTCAADDDDVSAAPYPPGRTTIDGIVTNRFPVDGVRDIVAFERLSRSIRYRLATLTLQEQEAWIKLRGPHSTALLRHLIDLREDFDAFVFVSYQSATAYFGLPLVHDRAHLVPLTQNEWHSELAAWQSVLAQAQSFICLTPEERAFIARRARRIDVRTDLCYPPIHVSTPDHSDTLRLHPKLRQPFILFMGRIDESHGCSDLCDLFIEYKATHEESTLNLVLAGRLDLALPTDASIHHIDVRSEEEKWSMLHACAIFAMQRQHESFPLATLEAWGCAKPVIVSGMSGALVEECRRSNGGLWYDDQATFDAVIDALTPGVARTLGRQGREYVARTFGKGNVLEVFSFMTARVKYPGVR